MTFRIWIAAICVALLALLDAPGFAANAKPEIAVDKAGHALSGYDAVSYFSSDGPQPGSDSFALDWNGATWLFISAANRDAFAADPVKYAPQFGGYCAWAVTKGQTYKSDPRVYDIVDGKLYMNLNKGVQAKWLKRRDKNIAAGRNNWPEVLTAGTWDGSKDGSSPDPGK